MAEEQTSVTSDEMQDEDDAELVEGELTDLPALSDEPKTFNRILQEQAEDDDSPTRPQGYAAQKLGRRTLTRSEIVLIARLREEGLSTRAIAKRLEVAQTTIVRCLHEIGDTRASAKAELRHAAHDVAKQLIVNAKNSSNADVQLEVLDRLDVLNKKAKDGSGPSVVINTGDVNRLGVMMDRFGS